ncbi:hypothetical protein [Burkholderia pseudomallei]|uniref:hypothetical protein n=1 Tax=Burkholderia pseudomallei TaxID=28450 RepID=UPI00211622D1|nr:hypothetical protein [Burkholderia pseudomallei]
MRAEQIHHGNAGRKEKAGFQGASCGGRHRSSFSKMMMKHEMREATVRIAPHDNQRSARPIGAYAKLVAVSANA